MTFGSEMRKSVCAGLVLIPGVFGHCSSELWCRHLGGASTTKFAPPVLRPADPRPPSRNVQWLADLKESHPLQKGDMSFMARTPSTKLVGAIGMEREME